MTDRSEEKLAVVAGGTGGLGRAVSRAFLEQGWDVAVTYRLQKEWQALHEASGEKSQQLEGYELDVTDERAIKDWIEMLAVKHRRVDALINTVGGYAGGAKLWEMEPRVFEQMLALNLRSGFVLARAVVPLMLRQGYGSIVNVASKAALDHAAGASAYVASKTAAVAMMDSLAAELKGTGVRVNSILPSIIDTEANRRAMPNSDFAKWPKPEEIAQVILFLCSDDAKLVRGAAIPVYGAS